MNIMIVAHYAGTLDGKGNNRFDYIASKLSDRHNVELVTTDHLKSTPIKHDYKLTQIHEINYRKNIGIGRLISDCVWGAGVKRYLKRNRKPDVIYCGVPSLIGPGLVASFCNKNNIKLIIDVQDLWPEAFKMKFNIPILSNVIFFPLKLISNYIYRSANTIFAVSQTYVDRAKSVNTKASVAKSVFLGTSLKKFDSYALSKPVLNKKQGDFWIGYCGTLGASYDLSAVIEALGKIYRKGILHPTLIVMGDGPRMGEFKKLVDTKNIKAVFTGRISYKEMCATLKVCDVAINPIVKGAAQSIINKHADYAASGKPVINTQECQEYRDLIEKYQMGVNCENSNPDDIANKIEYLCNNPQLIEQMSMQSRKFAEYEMNRDISYESIFSEIENNLQ